MTIEELSARLERVERANRRMRALGAAALLVLAGLVTAGFANSTWRDVKHDRIEIVDKQGKTRIRLSADDDGSPWIVLSDIHGGTGVSLSVSPDKTPFLKLSGPADIGSAILMVGKDADPKLLLSGSKFTDESAALSLGSQGPGLRISAGKGKGSASVSALGGDPALLVFDKDGRIRSVVGSAQIKTDRPKVFETTEPSSVVLFDKDGKVLERLPR